MEIQKGAEIKLLASIKLKTDFGISCLQLWRWKQTQHKEMQDQGSPDFKQ